MTDRFETGDRTTRVVETFQLEEIPQIESGNFEDVERAAIERVITEQQELLTRVQTDVLDVRSERNALEHQLSKLEGEREQLRDRIHELEAQRPALEPKTIFSNLGAALDEVDEDLAGERYSVDDVEFTLKTNVIQTDEGVRMHLPSLDETSATANLSEVSFRLRAPKKAEESPERDYTEVPDLQGLPYETAARRIASTNLDVGTVETRDDPTARPGTVLEQFPDPHIVARPGAPVDLVLVEEPDERPKDESANETEAHTAVTTEIEEPVEGETSTAEIRAEEDSTDEAQKPPGDDTEKDLIEAFRHAIIETESDSGSEFVERLHRAGIDDVEALFRHDAEELAERLSIPVERIVSLQERLADHYKAIQLEQIDGIGPTYADRLHENGIEDITQLVELDPQTASEITNASLSRTEDWIEQARRMLRQQ